VNLKAYEAIKNIPMNDPTDIIKLHRAQIVPSVLAHRLRTENDVSLSNVLICLESIQNGN
jgi:hypothetical protein